MIRKLFVLKSLFARALLFSSVRGGMSRGSQEFVELSVVLGSPRGLHLWLLVRPLGEAFQWIDRSSDERERERVRERKSVRSCGSRRAREGARNRQEGRGGRGHGGTGSWRWRWRRGLSYLSLDGGHLGVGFFGLPSLSPWSDVRGVRHVRVPVLVGVVRLEGADALAAVQVYRVRAEERSAESVGRWVGGRMTPFSLARRGGRKGRGRGSQGRPHRA